MYTTHNVYRIQRRNVKDILTHPWIEMPPRSGATAAPNTYLLQRCVENEMKGRSLDCHSRGTHWEYVLCHAGPGTQFLTHPPQTRCTRAAGFSSVPQARASLAEKERSCDTGKAAVRCRKRPQWDRCWNLFVELRPHWGPNLAHSHTVRDI